MKINLFLNFELFDEMYIHAYQSWIQSWAHFLKRVATFFPLIRWIWKCPKIFLNSIFRKVTVSNKKFLIWLLNCKLLRHDFGLHGKHLSLCQKGWAYFLCNFSKGKEIEFINTLEAQNKRHEIMSKHQVSEARLQDIQVSGTGVCVRERLTPGHTDVM